MTTNSPQPPIPRPARAVSAWLLDADPAIRWQVMRDLTDASDEEVAAERARVATAGWGAQLLALQGADGRWGGAAAGAYFGQDVQSIVDRLLAEQLADGGWNCEAQNGSTRSSFNTTICVLEALLEHELSVGSSPAVTAARRGGEEYLLERHLFRRKSTGEVIARDRKGNAAFTSFAFPTWWHYDVLRGLEYLRRAGVTPDERVAEAIDLVASKCDSDGRWPLEVRYPGLMPVAIDEGEGQPSRWNTLRALRVLDWYAARD